MSGNSREPESTHDRIHPMRPPFLITLFVLSFAAPRAVAAERAADPRSPDFWIARAARELAAAPNIEFDGHAGTPRLTAAELAADVYRLDPTPAHRAILTEKV